MSNIKEGYDSVFNHLNSNGQEVFDGEEDYRGIKLTALGLSPSDLDISPDKILPELVSRSTRNGNGRVVETAIGFVSSGLPRASDEGQIIKPRDSFNPLVFKRESDGFVRSTIWMSPEKATDLLQKVKFG